MPNSNDNDVTPMLKPNETKMFHEAGESADAIARQLVANDGIVTGLVDKLKAAPPRFIVTCARGSSDHAATFGKYVFETQVGLMTASASPSISSIYHSKQQLDGALYIAISQSGGSPDLAAYASACRRGGASTLALVNAPHSPLGKACDLEVLLRAGVETSVAATKSTVAAALAGLGLVAGYCRAKGDAGLHDALASLPARMAAALEQDWEALSAVLPGARAVYVLGRGATLGIAKEIALKISETTGVPALAFSSAEFLHGPLGAVSAQTPVIGLCSAAEHRDSVNQALRRAGECGAPTLSAFTGGSGDLSLPPACERFTDAVLMLPPAYLAIEAATRRMGRNPDAPASLSKVTQTL